MPVNLEPTNEEPQEVEVLEAKLICPRCGATNFSITPLPPEQGRLLQEVWKPQQGGVVGVADCQCSKSRPFLVSLPPAVARNIYSIICACETHEREVGTPWIFGVKKWLFGR